MRVSRRAFLTTASLFGVQALLAACGGSAPATVAPATAPPAAPTAAPTVAASGAPAATVAATRAATTAAQGSTTPTAVTGTAASVSTATRAAATSSAAAGVFPRTVAHKLGSTTIPRQPTRVVTAIDREDLDNVLALGVKPVLFGYSNAYGTGIAPWQKTLGAADLPQYVYGEGVNVEAVAQAKPDLIIGTRGFMEKVYPQLSTVAPTVATQINEQGWRDGLCVVAQALGREAVGEQVIAETERAIAAGKGRLAPLAGRKLMMGAPFGANMLLYGPEWPTFKVLGEMGVTASGEATGASKPVSFEDLKAFETADDLIIEDFGGDLVAKLEALPIFRALPAVRNGHYSVLNKEATRALYLQSALNIPWALPSLIDTLLQTAEGRGKKLG